MKTNASSYSASEREHLRARFALRVASALSERADQPDHDVSERLRVAREQAVLRAREIRLAAARPEAAAAPAVVALGQRGGVAVLGGQPRWWFRLASALPVIVLAAGLVTIDHLQHREQTAVAAEIDTALLADDLPPDAYSDPGFVQYLKSADSL